MRLDLFGGRLIEYSVDRIVVVEFDLSLHVVTEQYERERKHDRRMKLLDLAVIVSMDPVQRERDVCHQIANEVNEYTVEPYRQKEFCRQSPSRFLGFGLYVEFAHGFIDDRSAHEREGHIEDCDVADVDDLDRAHEQVIGECLRLSL